MCVRFCSNIIPGASTLENSFLYAKAAISNTIRCMTAPPRCIKSPYRSLDGTCNNLQNPVWGAANTRYVDSVTPNSGNRIFQLCSLYFFWARADRYSRLVSPKYGDGYASPTISITGQELPNARLVSLVAFGEDDVADPQFTLANMQWGQIITHDMSMLAGSTQSSRTTCLSVIAFHRNEFVFFFFFFFRETRDALLHRRRKNYGARFDAQNVFPHFGAEKRSSPFANKYRVS